MRSLALKLTLAFLLVGVVAVVSVGALVRMRTPGEIDRFVYDRNTMSLLSMLTDYYAANRSWEGVENVFGRTRLPGSQFDPRRLSIALADQDGRILYGQGEFRTGETVTVRRMSPALAIDVAGKTVGHLLVRVRLPTPTYRVDNTPETLFLERVASIILYSTGGAVLLALALGALLARSLTKPIRELTAATAAVASGRLGAQVPVRSHDELGKLAESFNCMSADLAHSTDLRRQMTADVAHDLRTPLSLLLGYTEALRDRKLKGSDETYGVMHDAARQLQHLVEDLNMLAQADAGELPLNRRPVDPRALLERTALAFMPQAQAQGITLTVDAAEDLPSVDVDPDRFNQVLTNLVANALRYTPAGGRVALSAAPIAAAGAAPPQILMKVADSGPGIAAGDLPHIFDRFYRGDKSRRSHNGEAGLGLAIARSIVESHGGTIAAESILGQGAEFLVRLPVSSA